MELVRKDPNTAFNASIELNQIDGFRKAIKELFGDNEGSLVNYNYNQDCLKTNIDILDNSNAFCLDKNG